MKRLLLSVVVVTGLVLVGSGCCAEQAARVDELTLETQDLDSQLRRCQDELDAKQAELTQCQDQLSVAMNKMNTLAAEVEKARNTQPQMPAGWETRKGMVVKTLPVQILFDPGKAGLKRGAAASLRRIFGEIQSTFQGQDVYVIGHTDTDPIKHSDWDDNLELSLQRAASVVRELIKMGMNPAQVVAGGCGEFRTTGKGKAQDRRVEFWVLKPL